MTLWDGNCFRRIAGFAGWYSLLPTGLVTGFARTNDPSLEKWILESDKYDQFVANVRR